jgi:hypothetical protein
MAQFGGKMASPRTARSLLWGCSVRRGLRIATLSLALGAPCAAACDPFDAPEAVGFSMHGSSSADVAAALASIADGGYRGPAFSHATREPYPSTVALGAFIDEWVSTAGYAEYSMVAPDAGGSGARLPAGSMIVRAVVDGNDVVSKLTIMLKGPAGYNPALGDWCFAETDPSGAPLEDDAGALVGRMSACYGCHLPRAGDDFLFGVPPGDRAPAE